MAKVFKWIALSIVGAIFIALASLLLFIQTDYARKWGTVIGLSYAHDYLNSTITVGKVEGNLYNHIELSDVSMELDSQNIVTIPHIQIYFSPLRLLLNEVRVDSVIISNGWVKAQTYADSSWNFAHIYKSSDEITIPDSNTTNLKVNINHIVLRNTTIETVTHYQVIPKQIDSLRIEGGFNWRSGYWGINLKQLSLKALNPSVAIRSLKLTLESQNDTISLKNFALRTPRNFIETDAFYSNVISYGASVWADSIDATDIQFLLPDITLPQLPFITFSANSNDQRVILNAKAQMNNEQVEASLLIGHHQPNSFQTPINEATVVFKNITLNHWGVPVDSVLLSGKIDVRTRALTSLSDTLFYKVVLDSSAYNSYKVDHLAVDGYFVDKSTRFKGAINSSQLIATANGLVQNIGSSNSLNVSGSITNFNLYKLEPRSLYPTNLNGKYKVVTSFLSDKPLEVNTLLQLTNSQYDKVLIDSALIKSVIKSDRVVIDSVNMHLPLLNLFGSGFATFSGAYDMLLQTNGSIKNVIKAYSNVELPSGNLVATTHISGVLDSLRGSIAARIDNFKLDSISFARIAAKGDFRYHNELAVDSLDATANHFQAYGIQLDSISVVGSYLNNQVGATVFAKNIEQGAFSFKSQTKLNDTITANIQDLKIETIYAQWYNESPNIELYLSKTKASISGLQLKDRLKDNFLLEANGAVDLFGNETFVLHLKELDLAHLYSAKLLTNSNLRGIANLDIAIKGNARNPLVEASAQIDSFSYDSLKMSRITSIFTSNSQKANLNVTVLSNSQDSLFFAATSPLEYKLDTTSMHFHFPGLVSGRVWSNEINLQKFSTTGRNVVAVDGELMFDLGFSGHYNALIYKGMALLRDGVVIDKKAGINYSNINAKLLVDSNVISLDTLSITEGKGSFIASGWARFDTLKAGGSITNSNIDIKARNFGVLRSNKAEVVVDADFKLTSEKNLPTFDGEIRVLKSSFFIPAFMQTDYVTEANKTPLLVEAQNKQKRHLVDSLKYSLKTDTVKSQLFTNLMENLTGSIKVDIPKNSWLKSETSKIELNGQLFVAKTNPYFELLGKIEVTRGQVIVYERKFTIVSGALEFQGGRKINPLLDITTEYSFRSTNNVSKTLTLKITGKMEAPIISYLLDGNVISASDAYAYILFGVPLNEISGSSSESLDITSSISSEMVSKIISNQLSQTLGDAFSLDVIEVNAQNNMQNVAFTVGKYVTKDLFVTYQKGFGDASSSEATTDQLILEYELTKNFFFRLQSGDSKTSGVDFILKFER